MFCWMRLRLSSNDAILVSDVINDDIQYITLYYIDKLVLALWIADNSSFLPTLL